MRHARTDQIFQPVKRSVSLAAMTVFALVALAVPAQAWQASQPDAATQAALDRRQSARTLLTSALARIATNGSDSSALLDAGRASLDLEDYRAALGFLARAEQLAPRDGAIKAAMGSTLVRMENPSRALDYFGDAQLTGAPERLFLSDRGLARDLLGQQDAAQRDYQLALSLAPNDETTRRYALSLGISGQADEGIKLLVPQLRTQSRAAWRTRAMILAINGRDAEASQIVKATMPPELSSSILPYLTEMDRLTAPQQAAAAHFGRFPSGPLPPRRAHTQIAAATPPPASATAKSRTRTNRDKKSPPVVAAIVQPTPTPLLPPPPPAAAPGPAKPQPEPVTVAALPVRRVDSAPLPAATTIATAEPATASAVQGPPDTLIAPGFSISSVAPSSPSSATLRPRASAPLASLADIVGSIEIPPEELERTKGAVDAATLAKMQEDKRRAEAAEEAKRAKEAAAAKVKADADAKARAEAEQKKANPARDWVQIATGANARALAFDFRRFTKQRPDAFKGQDGATTEWGQTRRLLVGPFKDRKAAQAWLTDYKKAGGDAFLFSSDAGQTVDLIK